MKKYIKPALVAVEIKNETILAGSDLSVSSVEVDGNAALSRDRNYPIDYFEDEEEY